MAGYITLPMFEISERPFAVRLADWLERVAVVPPDAGATVATLRAELARALTANVAPERELASALHYLATRVQVGQRIELVPVGPEPGSTGAAWFAAFHSKEHDPAGWRAQCPARALLGLSSHLRALPWLGVSNPALHYSQPPASSQK